MGPPSITTRYSPSITRSRLPSNSGESTVGNHVRSIGNTDVKPVSHERHESTSATLYNSAIKKGLDKIYDDYKASNKKGDKLPENFKELSVESQLQTLNEALNGSHKTHKISGSNHLKTAVKAFMDKNRTDIVATEFLKYAVITGGRGVDYTLAIKPQALLTGMLAGIEPKDNDPLNPFSDSYNRTSASTTSDAENNGTASSAHAAVATHTTALTETGEITDEVGDDGRQKLLNMLSDYCNNAKTGLDNLPGAQSHRQKLADDFKKQSSLGQLFEISEKDKTSGYSVSFKAGQKISTNAQLNDIINAFKKTGHKEKSSPLMKAMNELYTTTFKNTQIAQQVAQAAKNKEENAREKANQAGSETGPWNKAWLLDQKYNTTKDAYKALLLEHVSNDRALSGPELTDFAHRVMTATKEYDKTLREKINNKGKQHALDPFDYDFFDEVAAFFHRADVTKTTATFLNSQKATTDSYSNSLVSMLQKLSTISETSQQLVNKANSALKGAKAAYHGNDNTLYAPINNSSPIAADIMANCRSVGANIVQHTVKQYDDNYTQNVSAAIGEFDLKKAEEHSNKTRQFKINNAHVFTSWFDTINSVVAEHDTAQDRYLGAATDAMINTGVLNADAKKLFHELTKQPRDVQNHNYQQALAKLPAELRDIRDQQDSNRLEVLNKKSNKLKAAIAETFKPDFNDVIKQAAEKTSFREYLPKWLGGTTPDVEKGKRVFEKMEVYNNGLNASVIQIVKDCATAGKTLDETNAVVLAFRKSLPSPTEMLKTVDASIPPAKSIWGYFKQSFGTFTGVGALIALGAVVFGVFTSSILVVAGAGVLIVGGVIKLRSAINTQKDSQAVHDKFNNLAKEIDTGWPDSSKSELNQNVLEERYQKWLDEKFITIKRTYDANKPA